MVRFDAVIGMSLFSSATRIDVGIEFVVLQHHVMVGDGDGDGHPIDDRNAVSDVRSPAAMLCLLQNGVSNVDMYGLFGATPSRLAGQPHLVGVESWRSGFRLEVAIEA